MTAPVSSAYTGGATAAPFTSAVAGGQLGKNEFIKLLVAQMTHQDPLNPLDGQQMAAQLAQFSSVEQLMNLGTKLDAQAMSHEALLGVVNNSAAVSLIGKTVMVLDDLVAAGANGTRHAEVVVPEAGVGTLRVLDLDGNPVRSVELGTLAAGTRTIDVASALDGLPDGPYRIEVELRRGGETETLPTSIAAMVDGVRLSATGAHVTAGAISYPIGAIESVRAAQIQP